LVDRKGGGTNALKPSRTPGQGICGLEEEVKRLVGRKTPRGTRGDDSLKPTSKRPT